MLLIVLGVIIVGIATAVGFAMFADNAASSNRDSLTNDLSAYAVQAQSYMRKPTILGGGGGSMAGYTLPGNHKNADGSFAVTAANWNTVTIQAVGTETGYDEVNPVKVSALVSRDSMQVTELN